MSIPKAEPSAARAQGPDNGGALIPLVRALDVIAGQICDTASVPVIRTELFDGLACTVSALVPLFILDGPALRQLADKELDNALFRKGGAEMYFVDGRPPIHDLVVTPEGIAKVIGILKGSSLQA